MPRPLRILISGAGITGPALAHWLTKLPVPFTITIVERHPNLRASGQQIDLRGHGITAIQKMGIEPAVRAILVDEPGAQLVDTKGNRQAYLEANRTGKGAQTATAEFEFMRGDLVNILYGLTKDRDDVEYLFGTEVTEVSLPDGNGDGSGDGLPTVTLSNGRKETYDLVVGADGLGSRVRKQMLALSPSVSQQEIIHPLNIAIAFFTVPAHPTDNKAWSVMHLPGGRVVMSRKDSDDCLRVYLSLSTNSSGVNTRDPTYHKGSLQDQKKAWAEAFKDVRHTWHVDRWLTDLFTSDLSSDFYAVSLAQIHLDSYSRGGRIVLVGDAAACPTPATGLGTTLGLVGAYVLGGELAKALGGKIKTTTTTTTTTTSTSTTGKAPEEENEKDPYGPAIAEALANYDKTLKPIVKEAQHLSPGALKLFSIQTRWGIWVLHNVMWLAMALRIDKILNRFNIVDDRGGWDVPDYEELDG